MRLIARWVSAVILCLICRENALAQTTRPTTMPQGDVPSVRSALRELSQAMTEGQVSVITGLFWATNDSEERMVDADARMAGALADLHRAALHAFGEEGAKLITGDTSVMSAQSLARIDAAEIQSQGDVATVVYPDQKDTPFLLKKIDGRWRVPVAQLAGPADAHLLDLRLADLAVQRQVVEAVTRQIRAKKFETAEQAREAWRSRILSAATSQPAPQKKD